MGTFFKSNFVNGAIIVVSILIGLMLVVISLLAFELAKKEQLLPLLNAYPGTSLPAATTIRATPPPRFSTPTSEPVHLLPTRSQATRVPINPPTAAPAATTSLMTSSLISTPKTPVSLEIPAPSLATVIPARETPVIVEQSAPQTEYIHPTFEPTTQPCQNCHEVYGSRGE